MQATTMFGDIKKNMLPKSPKNNVLDFQKTLKLTPSNKASRI